MNRSILIVAGETSGDMHAARIVEAVQERDSGISFWGIGGDNLAALGVDLEEHVRDMDAMGVSEVLRKYFYFRRVFKRMLRLADQRKPDALLLVDYPGFNLRLAKEAKRRGLKVIYYVCPQVWAWRISRSKKMAKIIDRLLVIFPFEKDIFADTGLKVDFVGHPLVEKASEIRTTAHESLPWGGEKKIALLPGSRKQEVERILPLMWRTAKLLDSRYNDYGFLIAAPSDDIADCINNLLHKFGEGPRNHRVVVGKTRQVLSEARAGMVASGTATIEAALLDCPMIVVYSVARFTYWLGRKLVQVPHIGMVNIVAKHELCPEFIQGKAIPTRMAEAMAEIVSEGPERQRIRQGLERVREKLGRADGIERAAEIVLEEIY